MVTRTQIDNARPESVLAMTRAWKRSAADLVTAADTYRANIRNPGGQGWTGATTDAAIRMADRDHSAISNLRQAIDAMADTAAASISAPVIPNLNDVRAKIADAEAAGFTVGDDLSVSFPPTTPPDPRKIEEAERRAAEIAAAAAAWWDSDQAVADQIDRDKQNLTGELHVSERPTTARYERLLREAGLLTGPTPDGFYAQWLENAERRRVSPEVIVDIARRHGITPEDFAVLDGMEQITDSDGKSFFLLPTDISGEDARKGALMTYILNAGTDYGAAGRRPGVRNDFPETPYSADEVQRIIDRQDANSWSYNDDVGFVHGNGGRLVTTPNGIMMGAGGNRLQDLYSWKGGTAWGDIFMFNIDNPEDAGDQLRDVAESGRAWYVNDETGDAYAGNLDLDRLLHHEERHSQQWADKGYGLMVLAALTDIDGLERDAGLSDGGY